jgi:DNA-binding FadR family transcriptional regulator
MIDAFPSACERHMQPEHPPPPKVKDTVSAANAVRKAERGRSHLEIAATLGGEILSGTRPPGSRLPSMDEMFQLFGVSRLVVREVIRTLAAKGMVTSKAKVGTRVCNPAQWNWLDPQVLNWRSEIGLDQVFLIQLTQVRLALEPAAASLAAENRTDEDLLAMRAALKGMYQSGDDHQKFSKSDRTFHDAIIAATHNPFFNASSSAMNVALSRVLSVVASSVTSNEMMHVRSAAQHEKILDAIAARKPKAAADTMIRVVRDGLKYGSRLPEKKL